MYSQNKNWILLTCFVAIAEIKLRVLCMESEHYMVKKRQGLTNLLIQARLELVLLLPQPQLLICLYQEVKWSTYSDTNGDGISEGRKQC